MPLSPATIDWPGSVNQNYIEGTYVESPDRNIAQFDPEVGPPKVRRRFSMSTDTLSWDMICTRTEWGSLLNFFRDDAKDGTLLFTRKRPRTGDDENFMWAAPPEAHRLSANRFQVSIKLRTLGAYVAPWPTSGLTHMWVMDAPNVVGSSVLDRVAGLTGTKSGGVVSDGGPGTGRWLRFDGSTGKITLPSSPLPDFTSSHTIAAWLNFTDVASRDSSIIRTPVNWVLGSGDGVRLTQTDDPGKFGVNLVSGGTRKGAASSSQVFFNDIWVHVGYTFNGTASTIYIDGATVSQGADPGITIVNSNAYAIGERNDDTGHHYGSIFRLVVYNRALSGAEMLQLKNAL